MTDGTADDILPNIFTLNQTEKATMKFLRNVERPSFHGSLICLPLILFLWIMLKKPRSFGFLGGLALVPGLLFYLPPAQAMEIAPFNIQNQSPLVMIYGLPSIGEASLVPVGKVDGRFTLDFANNFIEISKNNPPGGRACSRWRKHPGNPGYPIWSRPKNGVWNTDPLPHCQWRVSGFLY